jgi:hypothetical protein
MSCHHFEHLKPVESASAGFARRCEKCINTGDTWVHLYGFLSCGNAGCREESHNKHATKHFRAGYKASDDAAH